MSLIILRSAFLMVATGLGVFFLNTGLVPPNPPWTAWATFLGTLLVAVVVILIDIAARKKSVGVVSAVYFGLIVGLFLAYVAGLALSPLPMQPKVRDAVQILLAAVLCYGCISLLMQTKDDFRFIIPYVEFAKEIKGRRPYVLDTSIIIDGRLADIVETDLLDSQLIMPRFVLAELQGVADSADRQRRTRGRRGLDILNRLRDNPHADLQIFDRELPEWAGQPVDMKLVALTKHLQGRLVTNDFNLNKVAKLHGVTVINLHDLANAMKPKFLPGDHAEVRIVRPGEEAGQGVGYLEDGTMVVVEGGRDHVDQNVLVSVTSTLQTSAGRMVFGRFESLRHHES
jgi:uncharacterized protein YacL